MGVIVHRTRTGVGARKGRTLALGPLALLGTGVVFLEGVLAQALQIIGAVDRNVVKMTAFALRNLAGDLFGL